MDFQFLQSFLLNMDEMITFAIIGKEGHCVFSDGILCTEQKLLDKITYSMESSVLSKIPMFTLIVEDGEIFRCIKTGQTGFLGKGDTGKVLIAQISESVSIIFLGEANYNGSFLYKITRALKTHELLNNGNIDQMNVTSNSPSNVRLQG